MRLTVLRKFSTTDLHTRPVRGFPLETGLALHLDAFLTPEIDLDASLHLSQFASAIVDVWRFFVVDFDFVFTVIDVVFCHINDHNCLDLRRKTVEIHGVRFFIGFAFNADFVAVDVFEVFEGVREVVEGVSVFEVGDQNARLQFNVFGAERLRETDEFQALVGLIQNLRRLFALWCLIQTFRQRFVQPVFYQAVEFLHLGRLPRIDCFHLRFPCHTVRPLLLCPCRC